VDKLEQVMKKGLEMTLCEEANRDFSPTELKGKGHSGS
jgi:hypothetical protein